jgi:hypothetical protein
MSVPRRKRNRSRKSSRRLSTNKRSSLVHGDMLRDPSLSFTRASRKRKVDPRSVLRHFPTEFRKDSSGRIRSRPSDKKRKTLFIPWFEPGEEIPVITKTSAERRLLGKWMDALNAAGRGNFSKIDNLPSNQTIGGVRLPTSRSEVQRILNALSEKESPFEGLYRTLARPS